MSKWTLPATWLRLAAGLSAIAMLAACGSSASGGSSSPQLKTLTVATGGSSAFFWLHEIAVDQGFYKQEGLNVETTVIAGGAATIVSAVTSGSVDIGETGTDSLITADEKGATLKVVGTEIDTPIFRIMSKTLTTYDELKGKVLGTSSLTSGTGLFIARLLAIHNVPLSSVKVEVIGATAQRVAALENGGIAAAPVLQPQDFQLEAQGYHVIGTSTDNIKNVNYVTAFADSKFIKSNGDEVDAYVRAMIKAAQFLYTPANRSKAIQDLVKLSGGSMKYAVDTYNLYVLDPPTTVIPRNFAPTVAGVRGIEDLMAAQKQLPTPVPDPSAFIDMSPIQSVLGSNG